MTLTKEVLIPAWVVRLEVTETEGAGVPFSAFGHGPDAKAKQHVSASPTLMTLEQYKTGSPRRLHVLLASLPGCRGVGSSDGRVDDDALAEGRLVVCSGCRCYPKREVQHREGNGS